MCRIALVSSGFSCSALIASVVGSMANLILRRCASRFTSSMTGNAPVPVPITSRRHFQGISSSIESGVCPNSSRNFWEGFFFALADLPSIDYHVKLVGGPVNTDRTEREIFEPHGYFRTLELVRPSFAHNPTRFPEKERSALIAWNQTGSGFQVPSYGSTVRRLYEKTCV